MRASRGSVMALSLVLLGTLVVILGAWLGYANTQNHEVVDQEQEEQSFHVAEAGVHYALFLLGKGVCTVDQLDSIEPVRQEVLDNDGNAVGLYDMNFAYTPYGSEVKVYVTSIGYDPAKPNRCQEVEASITSFSGALGRTYYIDTWNHKDVIVCATPPPVTTIDCGG